MKLNSLKIFIEFICRIFIKKIYIENLINQ